MSTPPGIDSIGISVRPMREADLVEARGIFSIAFGTFLGLPDPEAFAADEDYIFTRWRADPAAALVAEANGAPGWVEFCSELGQLWLFGPLTVRPELWNRQVARKLLEPTMDLFEKWGTRETGLFTLAQSQTHLALSKIRILAATPHRRPVQSCHPARASSIKYAALPPGHKTSSERVPELTDSIYEGSI